MALTPIGRAALVAREALKTRAYKDSVGVLTIGVGHTSMAGPPQVTPGLTITEDEALTIFDRDLAKYEATVDRVVTVPLADHERDALVSICYNIGQNGFARATFVRKLNAGDRAACAKAIMSWTKPPEITSRRQGESDQFLTPYDAQMPKARSTDRARVKAGQAMTSKKAAPPPTAALPAAASPAAPKTSAVRGLFNRILGRADAAAPSATLLPAERTVGDPEVYRVQGALIGRGYYDGEHDGDIGGPGSKTRAGIRAAQADNGLEVTGQLDAAFLAALPAMPVRALPASRTEATVKDMRAAGSTPIAAADGLGMLGRIMFGTAGLGGLDASGALGKVKDTADQATATLQSVQAVVNSGIGGIQWLAQHWYLILGVLGIWAALKATKYALEFRALYRQGTITRAGA